jgi:hypothetical protein
MSDQPSENAQPRLITVTGMAQASPCAPASYFKMQTAPQNIKVTNVVCSDTGTGLSICAFVDPTVFANKVSDSIQKAQTRTDATACTTPCTPFKLADFDKTHPYSGSSALFLDGLGRVVPSGPSAVSKMTFNWSFDLRFFGEVGLCLAEGQTMTPKGATPMLG